ncbi:MAG: hypothetical protein H8D34_13915, partial [Chloroflexi bacterium]|nr:hypothetical protein [Chloroflexota bacterium]
MTYSARVLIINRANPEMNYLAAALAGQGMLLRYVRPYFYQGRVWEQALLALLGPRAGQRTLFRRSMPTELNEKNTLETAVLEDFAMMFARRAGSAMPGLQTMGERWMQQPGLFSSGENMVPSGDQTKL